MSCRNMRGVGANLQDHLQLRTIYNCRTRRTMNESYHSLFAAGMDGR